MVSTAFPTTSSTSGAWYGDDGRGGLPDAVVVALSVGEPREGFAGGAASGRGVAQVRLRGGEALDRLLVSNWMSMHCGCKSRLEAYLASVAFRRHRYTTAVPQVQVYLDRIRSSRLPSSWVL